MSTAPCTILVVGATGQQGGSVLAELSRQLSTTPEAKVKVLALTRTASSPKAQALPSKYPSLDLSVVEGDAQHPEPIFKAHPDIDTVFSYTTPPDEDHRLHISSMQRVRTPRLRNRRTSSFRA